MSRLINNCDHSPFKGVVFSNILKSNLKIYMLEKAETENEFLVSKNAKNMFKATTTSTLAKAVNFALSATNVIG